MMVLPAMNSDAERITSFWFLFAIFYLWVFLLKGNYILQMDYCLSAALSNFIADTMKTWREKTPISYMANQMNLKYLSHEQNLTGG